MFEDHRLFRIYFPDNVERLNVALSDEMAEYLRMMPEHDPIMFFISREIKKHKRDTWRATVYEDTWYKDKSEKLKPYASFIN